MWTLAALVLLAASAAAARSPDSELRAAADKRLDTIAAEISALGPSHPWAGFYDTGVFFGGTTLALAPKSGFWVNTNSDVDILGQTLVGRLEKTGAEFRFARDSGTFDLDYFQFDKGLTLVPWGERRYLLRPSQLVEFINDINAGLEPTYDRTEQLFMMRDGDDELPVSGVPDLPASVKPLLRRRPIEARILSVDGSTIVLDAGRRQGVIPGLELHPRGKDRDGDATVREVFVSSSIAGLSMSSKAAPAPGWTLSTRRDYALSYSPFETQLAISTRSLSEAQPGPAPAKIHRIREQGYLGAARQAGFQVEPVVEVKARAAQWRLLWRPRTRRLIHETARAAGANAILDPYVPEPMSRGPGPEIWRRTGYRISLAGVPLEHDDMPSETKDWPKAKAEMAFLRNPYWKEMVRIRQRAVEKLLHMSEEEFDTLEDRRVQYLKPEQRAALEKHFYVSRHGLFDKTTEDYFEKSNKWWDELQAAQKDELDGLKASDPKGFAEYSRLDAARR